MKVKSQSEVAQLCLTLSDPMDCSLPGSSVHGIFQARVLEWGAIPLPSPLYYLLKLKIHLLAEAIQQKKRSLFNRASGHPYANKQKNDLNLYLTLYSKIT